MKEMQKDETKAKWYFRLKELVDVNPDPVSVRTMLLAFKDYDEGRIEEEKLRKVIKEYEQSANQDLSPQEFMDKYPLFKPLNKKR